jgi:hypothetical protein
MCILLYLQKLYYNNQFDKKIEHLKTFYKFAKEDYDRYSIKIEDKVNLMAYKMKTINNLKPPSQEIKQKNSNRPTFIIQNKNQIIKLKNECIVETKIINMMRKIHTKKLNLTGQINSMIEILLDKKFELVFVEHLQGFKDIMSDINKKVNSEKILELKDEIDDELEESDNTMKSLFNNQSDSSEIEDEYQKLVEENNNNNKELKSNKLYQPIYNDPNQENEIDIDNVLQEKNEKNQTQHVIKSKNFKTFNQDIRQPLLN